MSAEDERRASAYVPVGGPVLRRAVNAALLLRRPLLIRGDPGLGKSSLALHLARHFGLGTVLRWEISSRTTLESGLYSYDAVGHLKSEAGIDEFITLGPLGTALLPTTRPRVLLIDELDKAAYDLPNDLLHVFEEGHYKIPELARRGGDWRVFPYDHVGSEDRVAVPAGRIAARHHPIVVVTTNDEREFPEAFLRRVVTLRLPAPTPDEMREILGRWFGKDAERAERALAQVDDTRTAWKLQLAQLHLAEMDQNDATEALSE